MYNLKRFQSDSPFFAQSRVGCSKLTNIEHLASLTPEDFLSIRLYLNNDAGNILWEYAFELLSLYTVEDNAFNDSGDFYYVTADDTDVELEAALVGYSSRDEDKKTDQRVRWSIDGQGSMAQNITIDKDNGVFRNMLTMPTTAGVTGIVKANLGDDQTTHAVFREVMVLPGEPANIAVSLSGAALVQGKGNLVATAYVSDAHGNTVLDGTTVGFSVVGDSLLGSYQAYTEDGQVTVEIKGGFYSGRSNKLLVQVGEVEKAASFNVDPLNVVADVGSTLSTNQLVPVNLTVSSSQGPAKNVFVDISASHGRLQQTSFKTDNEGKLTVLWHTGSVDGTASITVGADRSLMSKKNITLTHAAARKGNVTQHVVVGDNGSSGTASFTDYSGASVALDYQTNAVVNVSGEDNQTINLSLDNYLYPNREPLIALPLQQISGNTTKELSTLHNPVVTNAELNVDHPVGVGQSIQLNGDGDIRFPISNALETNSAAIRLFLKASSGSGTVLNIGEGQRFAINSGVLQYTVRTTDGDFTVSSPITLNQWASVAARNNNGTLSLVLNGGVPVIKSITGSVVYNGTELILGENYSGQLSDFAYYDLESPPLLLLANNTENDTVTLDGSGQGVVTVNGQGALNTHQVGSQLSQVSIGLVVDGEVNRINVVSQSGFSLYAGLLAESIGSTPSQAQVAELFQDITIYNDSYSPLDKVIGMASDTGLYTDTNALLSVIGSMAHIAEAQPLLPYVDQLQGFYSQFDNQQMVYAAVDVLGEAVKNAVRHQPEKLENLLLPLVVLSEMIQSQPGAATLIGASVKSKEDFQTWMDFLALPADGWPGLFPPRPALDATDCSAIAPNIYIDKPFALSTTPCRLTGALVGAWINTIAENDAEISADPHTLAVFVNRLYDVLPLATVSVRKFLFGALAQQQNASIGSFLIPEAHAALPVVAVLAKSVKVLMNAGKKGVNNYKAFLSGKSNSRVDPLRMMFIMSYLEGAIESNEFTPVQAKRINSLISKVIARIVVTGKLKDQNVNDDNELVCKMWDDSHGAMFELMVIAFYHALSKTDDYYSIKGLDLETEVKLANPDGSKYTSFKRRTDIVLKGDQAKPVWVELKSLQAHRYYQSPPPEWSKLKKKWPLWSAKDRNKNGKKAKSTYHRQFSLDYIATRTLNIDGEDQHLASEMRWLVHNWATKGQKVGRRKVDPGTPYDAANFSLLKKHINKIGRVNTDILRKNLQMEDGTSTIMSGGDMDERFKRFNWATELTTHGLDQELAIPDEIQQSVNEFLNDPAIIAAEVALEALNEFDPVSVPDEWWDWLGEEFADIEDPFLTVCD